MNAGDLIRCALKYRDLGFSVIPVHPDQKPFIKWEQYQKKHPNQHEIRRWDHNGFRKYPLEEALKLKEIFSLRK